MKRRRKTNKEERIAEPSPAELEGARPGRGRARPGAELMLGRAELPPAWPEVGRSIINLAYSDTNDHSPFLAQFEAILAPFSRLRKPFQAQQGARQPRGREAPSRDEYLRRSCPRRVQNEIQNASNKRGAKESSKKQSRPKPRAGPRGARPG